MPKTQKIPVVLMAAKKPGGQGTRRTHPGVGAGNQEASTDEDLVSVVQQLARPKSLI